MITAINTWNLNYQPMIIPPITWLESFTTYSVKGHKITQNHNVNFLCYFFTVHGEFCCFISFKKLQTSLEKLTTAGKPLGGGNLANNLESMILAFPVPEQWSEKSFSIYVPILIFDENWISQHGELIRSVCVWIWLVDLVDFKLECILQGLEV